MRRDRWLLAALVVGLVLRVLPLLVWPDVPCVRDECTYLELASRMAAGEGMTPSSTYPFVWAPLYVALLAVHELLFGYGDLVLVLQIIAAGGAQVLVYLLARDHLDLRAGRIAAWLYALSPTLAFFAGHLWTESLYLTGLLAILYTLGRARDRTWKAALLPGLLIGLCVLLRGVATYLLPIFLLAYVARRQWRHAAATALIAVLTVAPYSLYASQKFGGPVVSDTTLGQNLWISNNDFGLLSWDYGLGQRQPEFEERIASGRPMCDQSMQPVPWAACQRDTALSWIQDNPGEFIARIPQRLAYLFNPNSFLTRHVRVGRYEGLPGPVAELLCLGTIGFSLLAVWGGSVGAFARGRSWLFPITLGVVLYHCAAVAALVGMTRFRVPLDGIWLIWAAGFLSAPRTPIRGWRLVAVVVTLALAIPLVLWYLPVGLS